MTAFLTFVVCVATLPVCGALWIDRWLGPGRAGKAKGSRT